MPATPTGLRTATAWLAAASALAAVGLTGCSSGDAQGEGAPDPTPAVAPSAEVASACEALLQSDRLLLDPSSAAYEDVLRAMGGFAQTVADSVRGTDGATADQAARLSAMIDDAIVADETSALAAGGEFRTITQDLHLWGYNNCGFPTLDIAATDFLFEGVPDTLPAGDYAIALKNTGRNQHVIMLVRVAGDIIGNIDTVLEDLTEAVNDGDVEIIVAGAAAQPGQTGFVMAALDPGRYILFDPIQGANGTPQYKNGLKQELYVQ